MITTTYQDLVKYFDTMTEKDMTQFLLDIDPVSRRTLFKALDMYVTFKAYENQTRGCKL